MLDLGLMTTPAELGAYNHLKLNLIILFCRKFALHGVVLLPHWPTPLLWGPLTAHK
jgi:hypothetical protein